MKFILLLALFGLPFGMNASKETVYMPETIQWVSLEEAYKLTKENPKKIFIDVYTDWCGWCKKMDKNTFTNPAIISYLNKHYYAVKFNAEQKENIMLGDQVYKFVASGSRGYHEAAAALLQGKMSYPTVVFLDEKFNMIQPVPGYQEPKSLEPILVYLGEDHHKKTAWADFQKNFKSSI